MTITSCSNKIFLSRRWRCWCCCQSDGRHSLNSCWGRRSEQMSSMQGKGFRGRKDAIKSRNLSQKLLQVHWLSKSFGSFPRFRRISGFIIFLCNYWYFLLSSFAVCIPINSNYLWRVRSHYNLEKAFYVPISNILNVQSLATLPYFSGSIH